MKSFKRTFRVGKSEYGTVWLQVTWDGSRLSFTGVEGPLKNGDCRGGCGQISLDSVVVPMEGIDVKKLSELWNRWHLNDVKAGCVHQREQGWNKRPIDPSKPLNAYGKFFDGQGQDSWNMLVWVRRDEHPEGLLCEPCPECGYRYGTQWLREEVPEDVLVYLSWLPDEKAGFPWK